MQKKRLLALIGAGVAVMIALTSTPAQADPTGTPTYRDLVAVGSDTTQGVLNGLSEVVTVGGVRVIGSYDAVPQGSTITTKDPAVNPACTNIGRPSGSGNGVTALVNSIAAGNGCIQFARSSSNNSASFAGRNLTYIPFATDVMAYAVRSDSTISKKLTRAQLTAIYNCAAGVNYRPLLPQFGSGTRQYFLQQLGFTDSATFTSQPNHTCIVDTIGGTPIEENVGTLLTDPRHIAPYSVGPYLAQINAVVPDVHGRIVLGQIEGIAPLVSNIGSTLVRTMYNVVPTGQLSDPVYQSVFVGPTSQICANSATIAKYGFGLNANCGNTSLTTP
ncbi:hypothetical protein [Catellatospora citrea]|uniref:ABC-type phosphate transport system substrate-binding protein n=1 Tax=Catellatospora citrea TaxID=53366 RepID=A0A8J3NXR7_9ACTN|nr:hypothetical protein [Catellatospora citrea]RKE11264.1 ABC-type phosphate transport system substrate-binding protein [Catellatospora citrea]GIF96730.1 hypothetical protein Cci01nite_18240 [Catellatospora citrea]